MSDKDGQGGCRTSAPEGDTQVTQVGWRSKQRRLTDVEIRKKPDYHCPPGYRPNEEKMGLP
jgi:hypothetical protein